LRVSFRNPVKRARAFFSAGVPSTRVFLFLRVMGWRAPVGVRNLLRPSRCSPYCCKLRVTSSDAGSRRKGLRNPTAFATHFSQNSPLCLALGLRFVRPVPPAPARRGACRGKCGEYNSSKPIYTYTYSMYTIKSFDLAHFLGCREMRAIALGRAGAVVRGVL